MALTAPYVRRRPPLERLVPVTAKLSRKFYDTFGDEITNEFVEWFNNVDATYRAELREQNRVIQDKLVTELARATQAIADVIAERRRRRDRE